MRIGLLIDTLNSGGAQRQLVLLAKELKARGHDVAVCVYMPGRFYARELQSAGIELIEMQPANRWQKFTMVYAWLRKWKPQILQAFLEMPSALAELTSLLPHSWKIVGSERNVEPFPITQQQKRLTHRLIRYLHRRADWITTNSHANMAQLLHSVPNLEAKVSVIWNMVDLEQFSRPTVTLAWAENSIIRFLCVASMYQHKNGPRLIEALHLLRQRDIHNFHVRWVGRFQPEDANNAKTYAEVIALVQRYQLQNHFTFAGEKENVVHEYHTADALVLVSLCEGMPNVVCEGMACQLPVVLSDVSDHSRIVEEGRTGFLCSPYDTGSIADALQSIIRLPAEQRRAMGKAARRAAEAQFNRKSFIDGYERIYRHLLNTATSPGR